MNTTNINIRIDKDIKRDAELVFNNLGMNLTTAFNIFVRQVIREQAIPFKITCAYNIETIRAFEEARLIAQDDSQKSFSTVEALFEELNSDD